MINPSAAGWIDKYFLKATLRRQPESAIAYYEMIRNTGFIYGHVVMLNAHPIDENLGWTRDEISKLALLEALYGLYVTETGNTNPGDFVAKAIEFYQAMDQKSFTIFKNVFGQKPSATLEEVIDERVQTNHDIISKNFSHIVTNALLFIDVLSFQRFLKKLGVPKKYVRKIEDTIISLISLTLRAKVSKSGHDDLLMKLFEASVRYGKFSGAEVNTVDDLKLEYYRFPLEKYYLIDIAGMVIWRDGQLENDEVYFLQKLAEIMEVDENFVNTSIRDTHVFLTQHYADIPYFHYSHPVRHFYDNLSQSVMVLITRNKKRLIREISQSKELMMLLAKSTQRDLDAREKKLIRTQILEICKTIPSLTIFLLPGGSLLLPLLIKFIPQLLPAAFNENIEKE